MIKSDYLFYSDYIKNNKVLNKKIFISKTKKSFLIGPLIDDDFDSNSFYKRLISNSIYSINIYKKAGRCKCQKLIKKYGKLLLSNEVLEVFNNGEVTRHKIIEVPGGFYEKE